MEGWREGVESWSGEWRPSYFEHLNPFFFPARTHSDLVSPRVRVRVQKRVPFYPGTENRVKEGKRVQKGTY